MDRAVARIDCRGGLVKGGGTDGLVFRFAILPTAKRAEPLEPVYLGLQRQRIRQLRGLGLGALRQFQRLIILFAVQRK